MKINERFRRGIMTKICFFRMIYGAGDVIVEEIRWKWR